MWRIELIDIGGDGLVVQKQIAVDTLPDCEVVVGILCAQHLGVQSVTIEHDEDLVYSVKVNGVEVGVAVIKTL